MNQPVASLNKNFLLASLFVYRCDVLFLFQVLILSRGRSRKFKGGGGGGSSGIFLKKKGGGGPTTYSGLGNKQKGGGSDPLDPPPPPPPPFNLPLGPFPTK